MNGRLGLQQKDHYIDGKKIEAKAAVPKNSNNSPTLTRKMFVGGTVRASSFLCTSACAQSYTLWCLVVVAPALIRWAVTCRARLEMRSSRSTFHSMVTLRTLW